MQAWSNKLPYLPGDKRKGENESCKKDYLKIEGDLSVWDEVLKHQAFTASFERADKNFVDQKVGISGT